MNTLYSKFQCSAPLYLRTLWRYTNAVIIIIIKSQFCNVLFTKCLKGLEKKKQFCPVRTL